MCVCVCVCVCVCAGLLGGGCAEKETTMAKERWWKAPGMVALTSTENQYHIWSSLARRTKSGSLALK
jgi:hypothetical protein